MRVVRVNTTTPVVATVAVVVAGQFATDKPLTINLAIGAGAYALGLSLIAMANETLAQRFAVLVLVVALFRYVPIIGQKTGLIGKAK
jgi:hypothetical protein